ncbi:hypothetical protein [Cohnella kolymensis]
MKKTIADSVVEALLNAGVTRIYGIVGDSPAISTAMQSANPVESLSIPNT